MRGIIGSLKIDQINESVALQVLDVSKNRHVSLELLHGILIHD